MNLECLNCDQPIDGAKLFCSSLCRQTAKTVRYARAVQTDGRIARADVAEAVRIKIGSILGGGYPDQERRLSEAKRQGRL